MGPFLAALELRRAFRAELDRPAFVARATFHGCIVVAVWPYDRVEALVPEGIELAECESTPNRHPVVFLFGDQREGARYFAGLTFPTGIQYQEFALAVPWVRVAGSETLHTLVLRMVSSHPGARLAGNIYYGFGKQMGRMGWHGSIFLMTNEDDRLLFHAQIEPADSWSACAAKAPRCLDLVRAVFALPILGCKADGALITSYFAWTFDQARVRPIDAALSIDHPFAPGLAPGWCYGDPAHSVEVRGMTWQLSWPGATLSDRVPGQAVS
jgi:hypothetical protein